MVLGIDIGTSKTAAVLVSGDGEPFAVSSAPHGADLPAAEGRSEQDVHALLRSAWNAVRSLPPEGRASVRVVGLTGQMHGALLLDGQGGPVSPLVTWQDLRCGTGGFLEDLAARTGRALRNGYGCATLAWLAAGGLLPAAAAAASTIHDLAAAVLSGSVRPVTDPTGAASWGLSSLDGRAWDRDAVRAAMFPPGLLPEIVPCGAAVGHVSHGMADSLGIPAGIPVAAAIGDNQASLIATLRDPGKDLALILGTGGQLAAVLPPADAATAGPGFCAAPHDPGGASTWELRPYPGGLLLAVAACLSGGSAWRWLAETAREWMRDLGARPASMDEVYERLNTLGAAAVPSGLVVRPHFLGERHDPGLRGAIEGICLRTMPLGALALALAEGISVNLRDMMPPAFLDGRARLVGSGNALARNPLLRQAAERVFGLPLAMSEVREAAAVGAALNAAALPS